jgi:hypothetical protein
VRFSLPVNDHIQGGARDEQNSQDQRDDFDVDQPHLAADGAQTDDEKMADGGNGDGDVEGDSDETADGFGDDQEDGLPNIHRIVNLSVASEHNFFQTVVAASVHFFEFGALVKVY